MVKDKQKEFIVAEAAKMLLEKPIESVTISDIAHSVGVGEATIYRYFGKKENLVVLVANYLWGQINSRFFEKKELFEKKNGLEKIKTILSLFRTMYEKQENYLSFIDDFDSFVLQKKIRTEELNEYNAVLLKNKVIFDKFFEEGQKDGSINPLINGDAFYFTITHSLLSLCEKLTREIIVESDLTIDASLQIQILIDMAVMYIENNK